MKELGKRIKKRRLALNLSLKEVAAAANRSHGWLYSIEQGTGNPTAEALTAVAVKLGDDPREYLRLAGRVALTAADVTPLDTPLLPAGFAAAIANAVVEELRPLIERVAPEPVAPVQRAVVTPAPTVRNRRAHWLQLARVRRGWTIEDVEREIGRRNVYGRWEAGMNDPRGAEVRRLAEKLDIPEWAITNPPPTDAERLAGWHFGDDSALREAM